MFAGIMILIGGVMNARSRMRSEWAGSPPLASLALFAVDVAVIHGLASWDHRDR